MLYTFKELLGFFKRFFRTKCYRQMNGKKINEQNIIKSSEDPFICRSISNISQTSRKQLTEYSFSLVRQLKVQTQQKKQLNLKDDFLVAANTKRRQYILPKDYLQQLFKEIQIQLQSILQQDCRAKQQSKSQSDCFSQDYMKQYQQQSEQHQKQKMNIEKQDDNKQKQQSEEYMLKNSNKPIQNDAHLHSKSVEQIKLISQLQQFGQMQPDSIQIKQVSPQKEYISSNIQTFLFNQPEKQDFLLKKYLKIRVYCSLLSRNNKQRLRYRFRRLFRRNTTNTIHVNT